MVDALEGWAIFLEADWIQEAKRFHNHTSHTKDPIRNSAPKVGRWPLAQAHLAEPML